MANKGFTFLEEVVGDRGARVQGFKVLAELAQLRADVQEHEQNALVCGVVAVVFHVALHLRRPQPRPWLVCGQTPRSIHPFTPFLLASQSHREMPAMSKHLDAQTSIHSKR